MLLLVCLAARAQYMLVPVAPPPTFAFNDLWHFSVTRSAADDITLLYVSLRVYDDNNQLLAKSNSSAFALPVGTRYYNASNLSDLQPFTGSFYSGGLLQQAVASGGPFPAGSYVFVYTLYGKANDGEFAPLAEETSSVTVEALWPPMLLTPPDGDSIQTAYPLLSWTPAFSSAFTGTIEYTLNLAEVLAGQNAYQAIQANPVHFSQAGIPVTALMYPIAAQALDTGKTYAWQVHAGAGGASLGSSEVWQFTVAVPVDSESVDSVAKFFLELDREYPKTFFLTTQRRIPFRFQNGYNQDEDKNIRFTLTLEGEQEPVLSSETCTGCLLVTKEVYYTLDLEEHNTIKPGFYLLTVYDNTDRAQYLRILYKNE